MYLHIGNGFNVKKKEIIGIFDMDTATVSHNTRAFLSAMEKKKSVSYTEIDIPRSFILCDEKKKANYKIYISKISAVGLNARMNSEITEEKQTI